MGGKSFEPYSLGWTNTLKKEIRQRDNYTCQLCGCRQEDTTHLVHHIDYNKKNCNPDNLITLCRSCHTKTNTNRDYWLQFFKGKQNKEVLIIRWKNGKKFIIKSKKKTTRKERTRQKKEKKGNV